MICALSVTPQQQNGALTAAVNIWDLLVSWVDMLDGTDGRNDSFCRPNVCRPT